MRFIKYTLTFSPHFKEFFVQMLPDLIVLASEVTLTPAFHKEPTPTTTSLKIRWKSSDFDSDYGFWRICYSLAYKH